MENQPQRANQGHDNSNAQPPQQGASFGDALAGLPGLLRAVSLGGVFKTAPFSVLGSSQQRRQYCGVKEQQRQRQQYDGCQGPRGAQQARKRGSR